MSTAAATQQPRPNSYFQTIEDAVTPVRKSMKRFTAIHTGFIGAKEYLTDAAIDENLYSWITAAKLLTGITFIISIPKLICNIEYAYYATSTIEKAERIANALITASTMTAAAATCIEALKTLQWLPRGSFAWAPLVSSIFLPLQVISLELDTSQIAESYNLKNKIFTVLHTTESKKSRPQQIKDLTQSCNYIIENKRDLEKSLTISKKEKLDERAKEVLKNLKVRNKTHANHAINQGELLIDLLKSRASTKLNLTIASGASKAAAITTSAASLVFLSITAGWIAMAIVASVSLTVFVTEKLLMNKHPFDSETLKFCNHN